jgi:hypothetical protein
MKPFSEETGLLAKSSGDRRVHSQKDYKSAAFFLFMQA